MLADILNLKKQQVNTTMIILLLIISIFLLGFLLKPYLIVLFLSAILSAIFYPLYHKIYSWTNSKWFSSMSTIILFSLIILFPLSLVISMLLGQLEDFINIATPFFSSLNQNTDLIDKWNSVMPGFLQFDTIVQGILNGLKQIQQYLVSNISNFTGSAMRGFILFFVFYYAMYFFLKDGKDILKKFLHYTPMNPENTQKIMNSFLQVSKATLKGTIVIGIIQGSLAGIGFAIAGIPGALFWTIIMIVLSIIPVIGSTIVWLPVCIVLFLNGDQTTAILLGAYCMVVVGSVDNILRPILVGKDAQMSELMILLSTFGGLNVFGMVGVVLGPVIAAFFLSVLSLYEEEFDDFLSYDTKVEKKQKSKKTA